MHAPLAQHPPSQLVASQVAATQPPSWQLSVGQLVQAAPPPPQLLAVVPGWQTPVASQQPLGQEAALHALTQAFIRQVPVPHDSQVMPPLPHAVSLCPPTHTPPWQQPLAQVVASQSTSQTWFVHVMPVAHWLQATPPVPHAAGSVPVTHTPARQQPLGQVVGSQVSTHAPASHPPRPQDRQPIAPVPHESASRPARHCEPEQQPLAQLVALQAEVVQLPALHALPRQSRQARPPVPHDADESPVRQRPPMQQPAHEAAVHWQRPRRHSTPGSHAGPVPHWHSPVAALHLSAPMAAVHGGLRPQAQRPSPPHESVMPEGQVVHAAPPAPHADAFGEVMQVPFEQHPVHPTHPDIGASSLTVTARSRPFATTTCAAPAPTSAPPRRPSTRISTFCPSSVSASSTRTVEVLGSGLPAASGRSVGCRNGSPAASRPV